MRPLTKKPEAARDGGLATLREAAEFLSVGRTTIYGLMGEGRLPRVKIGKSVRVPWSALREIAEAVA